MPDPTYVELAVEEMQAQLDTLPPKIEGLRDYRSLNLHEDTKQSVISTIQLYVNRVALLTAAIDQCQKLLADGYPALPMPELPPEQLQDLQDNRDSIQTALELFTAESPVNLNGDVTLEPRP